MALRYTRGIELDLRMLALIYRSPKYVLLTVFAAGLYYLLFNYFVSLENYGLVIYSEPAYLVYLLSLSASVLLTITVYTLSLRLRRGLRTSSRAGLLASLSTVVGGCITGCACQAPILYSIVYFFGLNAFEASGVVTLFVAHDSEINAALVLLNVAVAFRLLSKISRVGGRPARVLPEGAPQPGPAAPAHEAGSPS